MLHGVRSKKSQISRQKIEKRMASEQVTMNETIAKAVAEAIRAAIQAMAATTADRPQRGGPAMKQPTFNWETEDKYSKIRHSN